MQPVKLYCPDRYHEEKLYTHTELLFPFWGVAAKESMHYVRAAQMQYQYSAEDFTLVPDIQNADYVLIPYHYRLLMDVNPEKVKMIAEEARRAGKLLLIDGAGDIETPITIPGSVILRISQYRYVVKPNEITIPFPAEDLLESYYGGQLQIRKKSDKPSVGFAGWAQMKLTSRLKTYIKELPITTAALLDRKRGAEHKGLLFREKAIAALQKTAGIEAHILARRTYSGYVKTITGSVGENRKQFVENFMSADYALCVKGDANASVRFYEALSLGKIPLFLDTACVLPLEDKINYRDFCVFVDWRDVDKIGEKLLEFHQGVSSERFEDMQKKARETFKNYLRLDMFSSCLASRLRDYAQVFSE